jgi:hypothetical protein
MKGAIGSLFASALVLTLGVRTAHADKPKKVVIEQFSGAASDQFKKLVAGAVAKQGIEVVSDKKRAATEADLGLLQVSDNYAAVAKELGVGAFIDGTVTGSKHLTARLKVKGPDGSSLGSASWTGANAKKLLNSIDDNVGKKLASILGGGGGAKEEAPAAEAAAKEEAVAEEAPRPKKKKAAAAPAADEEKPAKSEEDATVSAKAEKDSEEPSGPPSPYARFDLAAGAHIYGRNFSYNRSLAGGQQAYRLPAVPAPTIQVDVFVTKNIGISGSFEYSVALISEDKAGFRYTTSSMGYSVGAKYRLFFGATELTPGLAYSGYGFKITPEAGDKTPPQVAAVDYKQLKIGASLRLPVSDKFALVGGGNYLHLMSIGELGGDNYFPYATGRGGEGFAGIAFGLPWAAGLEGRLTADFRRYVFSMNSEQVDLAKTGRIAGGAVDQYVGANIMFAFRK